MIQLEASLLELKSQRVQLEIQLLGLGHRLGDLHREQRLLEDAVRRGYGSPDRLAEVRERAAELAAEIGHLEVLAGRTAERIAEAEQSDGTASVDEIVLASERASADLERLRTHLLETLRSLAGPLREHERLAERQRRLTRRIREASGKDNSYAAYLDTALMRTSDVDADLQFVLDVLRQTRVVA